METTTSQEGGRNTCGRPGQTGRQDSPEYNSANSLVPSRRPGVVRHLGRGGGGPVLMGRCSGGNGHVVAGGGDPPGPRSLPWRVVAASMIFCSVASSRESARSLALHTARKCDPTGSAVPAVRSTSQSPRVPAGTAHRSSGLIVNHNAACFRASILPRLPTAETTTICGVETLPIS